MSTIEGASNAILTIPNVISSFRLLLIPVFAVLVGTGHDVWALIVVAISSLSDWADGFIARKFNQVSELGKTLDPIADRCFILVTLIALVARDVVPLWLLGLVFVRDLIMLILVSLIAKKGHKPMAVTYVGKGATLFLLLAFPLFIFSMITSIPQAFSEGVYQAAWVCAVIGVVLYWASAFQYLSKGSRLLKSTPAPLQGDSSHVEL
ncbi:CDP-alcohol phosphatidyltransferase family protein [Timonella senegalensis]|uniref:CDP-alcohol phosphatidyltransferase family protein n=1 Tax=Timonella senegalensis TaxID=1465825 RepID=UPI00030AB12E|nr:CDP-alcohol phosphatidyltransferase family protein [Timonella senegalensis]